MPFEEKFTWVSLVTAVAVAGVYSALVFGKVGSEPVGEIAYQVPMLVAIGVFIALTIVGTIFMGIGTGIAITISGEGSPEDIGRNDERDADISRRGAIVGSYVVGVGGLAALVLTMMEYDYFWIANALYLSFVASSVASAISKLVAYRRGF